MMAFEEIKMQETVFTAPIKSSSSSIPVIPSSSSSSSPSSLLPLSSFPSRSPDLFDPMQTQPQQRESLVRYQSPVPAGKAPAVNGGGAVGEASAALQLAGGKRKGAGGVGGSSSSSTALDGSKAHQKPAQQLSDVLNAILPPQSAVDPSSGERVVQFVSTEPSSREQVIALQRQLDEKLQERQARESGICPVREELYSQCFDELIRQVCIASPERGLLLLRVRDELRMSISSYQSLYAQSITFGQRKGLQAELGRDDLHQRWAQLEDERRTAQRALAQQRAVYEAMEKRINEQRAAEEKKQQEEKDFLKYQAQHLEAFIKSAQQ